MKKQKLLKKRILAFALSVAMISAQADTYAVLAAATESPGETVEYDSSQSALTDELEVEEAGTEETKTETESGSVSDKVETEVSGLVNGQASGEEAGSSENVDSGTTASAAAEDSNNEYNGAESQDNVEESGETELSIELSAEEQSEEETEITFGDGRETGSVKESETDKSGTINDISWNIDADGLLTIEGTGDYMDADDLKSYTYCPPWASREDVKSAKVNVSGITLTNRMFYNCKNLENIDLSGFDTGSVTNMSYMFASCNNLSSLDLSKFDTGKVTSMLFMFSSCSSLSSLDLRSFDTGNVTDMSWMFNKCGSLSSLNLSSFNTSKVKQMGLMFCGCSSLTSLDLSNFDPSSVMNMSSMFSDCTNLSSLDLSNFDTRSSTNMPSMFYRCSSLTSLDLSSFDMGKVNGTNAMLKGCNKLSSIKTPKNCNESVELPISDSSPKWCDEEGNEYTELPINSSVSINLQTMQAAAISGVSISDKEYDGQPAQYTGTPAAKDSSGNTITDVTIKYLYSGTLADGSLYAETTQAPLQAGNYTLAFKLDKNNKYAATNATYNFEIKRKSITITAPSIPLKIGAPLPDLSSWAPTIDGQLLPGDSFITQPQLKYGTDNIQTDKAGTYEIIPFGVDAGNNYNINYVNGTLTIETAGGASGEEPGKEPDKAAEIVHEGASKNKKLTWTIDSNGKLTVKGSGNYPTQYEEDFGINVPEWYVWSDEIKSAEINVSGITTTEGMFSGCSKLKSIDLANLNTSKVKNMYNMFGDCNALETLDLSSFNTGSVTDMCAMFSGCGALETLDLSTFNTGSVTSMEAMFSGCRSLKSLDLSSFNTSKVKSMSEMFAWSDKLESVDLSSFNTSQAVYMFDMFHGCSSLKKLDLSNFNTAKVSQMYQMFDGCESLESVDLSSFNTQNASQISGMFSGCKSLESLDLSSFNTGKTDELSNMFSGCSSLVSLDLSSFDTRKVQYLDNMFKDCSSLTSVDLSSFDLKLYDEWYADNEVSIFDGCNSLSYIRTPKSCAINIALPRGASGRDVWYSALNTPCTAITAGLSSSLDLYKNGYPGDGTVKKMAFISGIGVNSMVYNGQSAAYFGTAAVMDSDKNKITDAILTYSYTGTLEDGSVYAQTTQAPSNAGSYKLTVKAESSDCSGQASYSFRIEPKTVIISANSLYIDTGAALPAVSGLTYTVSGLLLDDKLIAEPKLAYSENNIQTAAAGRYGIIPSGALAGNNYYIEYKEGTLTVGDPDDDSSFDEQDRTALNPDTNPALQCTIAAIKAKVYDGAAYEPALKVTVTENGKKKTLTEGTDYRVIYENNINAGEGKVIVKGSGIYKGSAEATFKINPKPIKKLKVVTGGVTGTVSAADVNDGIVSLPVYVYDAGRLLTRDEDYTLTYDTAKGNTLTVKVKGMNESNGSNYTGETKAKITVYEGADAAHIINPDNVSLKSYTEKYTGKALKPAVEVSIDGETISNKNYKVQYQNNKNAGTAYVIVTGKGAYKGKVVKAFEITVNDQKLSITNDIKPQTYNGKLIKPSVTVKAGDKKLKKNTDYTLTYKNNLHAGTGKATATVIVTGKGNYSGTVTKSFVINPLKASKITVKGVWKDSDGDGIKDGGALTVTYGKRLLKEGTDYTLEPDETSVKNNKIKVTLKAAEGSDFDGSVVKTLKME